MDKVQQQLLNAAKEVLTHSYSPYSKFNVGAAIMTDKGNIYTGTNIENVSYGLTLCAESAAIAQMVSNGETCIKDMLVMANHDTMCPPCGGCRQRIAEFTDGSAKIHMCNSKEVKEVTTLSALLPYTFESSNIKR